jgi:hypothetical protein
LSSGGSARILRGMNEVTPLPAHGAAFFDARDPRRSFRVSFHPAEGVFVLSMWRDGTCLSTFRLPTATAPELVASVVEALATPYAGEAGQSESA